MRYANAHAVHINDDINDCIITFGCCKPVYDFETDRCRYEFEDVEHIAMTAETAKSLKQALNDLLPE